MTFYDVTETIQVPNGSGGTTTLNGIAADGVTDDKLNLQLYINYVNSQGGGTLVLPGNKIVLISSQLTIYKNLVFKSSHAKSTIKAQGNGVYSFMNCNTDSYSITINGIEFDGGNFDLTHGIILKTGANITIANCSFKNFTQGAQSIYFESANNTIVENCSFNNVKSGIFYHKRNQHLRIEDNYFTGLEGHAIHLQGSQTEAHYCSDVIINGNYILINQQTLEQPGVHGLYLTCGDTGFDGTSAHHENVVVSNNIVIGPFESFANGGSADLISLKDIIRLKCYGNTARNSGDLGFAIERCHYGTVSNNTADQNNSCGISIFGSSHISVIGNVCGNNEQDHDENLNHPYGGIRVEFDSVHIIVSGNHFYGENLDPTIEEQQQYGIVVRQATVPITNNPTRSPYNIKIGINHYVDHSLGDIYNGVASTIIEDSSATVNNDY